MSQSHTSGGYSLQERYKNSIPLSSLHVLGTSSADLELAELALVDEPARALLAVAAYPLNECVIRLDQVE
jgi:hypothetical protein